MTGTEKGKHTPGKWTIHRHSSTSVVANDIVIANCGGWSTTRRDGDEVLAEQEANARLLSAAPDLLETVIAYRLHHNLLLNIVDDTDCPCKICQMAEAVIAKARGAL